MINITRWLPIFFHRIYIVFHQKLKWIYLPVLLLAILPAFLAYAANDLMLVPAVMSERAATSLLLDVVNTGERIVAVGERGHIIYSDDQGITWHQGRVPVSLTLVAVYFPTPRKGWAVGHDGIVLHTDDGGETWIKQLDGAEAARLDLELAKKLLATKEKELTGATAQNMDNIRLAVEDLRYAVEDLQFESDLGAVKPLLDVWFKNEQEGFVVGSFGMIYFTGDGGKTWRPAWERIDNPDRMHYSGITRARGALFIAGEAGTLYRSTDEGATWEVLDSPYEGSYFGVVASPEDEWVIAFGLGGNYAYSNDLGVTWQHVKSGAGAALSGGTVRSDGTVLMVSNSGVAMTGSCETGAFSMCKIRGCLMGAAETDDKHIVLVGIDGVSRIAGTEVTGMEVK